MNSVLCNGKPIFNSFHSFFESSQATVYGWYLGDKLLDNTEPKHNFVKYLQYFI